jgi:hypothetical protein
MVLKLVPITIEGVITRLMQERCGSRPSASLKEWRKILNDLVAAEEIEHLRKARLKIEQQANRIDELEAEVARLREAVAALKNNNWPERL